MGGVDDIKTNLNQTYDSFGKPLESSLSFEDENAGTNHQRRVVCDEDGLIPAHRYLWALTWLQPFLIHHIFKFLKNEIFGSEVIVLRQYPENDFWNNLRYT